MDHRQGEGAVGARTHLQKHVRLAADADTARVHNDGFHSARPGGDDVVGQYERRGARIMTPEQERFAVREVRGREIRAEGVAKTGVPMPVANVGR